MEQQATLRQVTLTETTPAKRAILYRMVMPGHTCPYGLKAKDLLRRRGFRVEDRGLTTRAETDAFKAEHGVNSTPQIFVGDERIGGYGDLRRWLGLPVADTDMTSYTPVIAVFLVAGALALAVSQALFGTPFNGPRWRMVRYFRHGGACHAEAAGRRTLLDHVPELRPARQALGALQLRLPIRRTDRGGC